MCSSKSSPEVDAIASISMPVMTETFKDPVIFAPLICEPVTTISSISLESEVVGFSWDKTEFTENKIVKIYIQKKNATRQNY